MIKELFDQVDIFLNDGYRSRMAKLSLLGIFTPITESQKVKSANLAAIDRVLSESILNSIHGWDEQTASEIVNYLIDVGYKEQLTIWIQDKSRLKLDSERVEEIERVVEKCILTPPETNQA